MSEFKKLSREEWAAGEAAATAFFAALPNDVKDIVHKVYGDMMAAGYNRTQIRNAIAADYLKRHEVKAEVKADVNAAVKAKYSPAHKAKAAKATGNVEYRPAKGTTCQVCGEVAEDGHAHGLNTTKTTENVASAVGKVMTSEDKIAALEAKIDALMNALK